jgi:hypothetical protein
VDIANSWRVWQRAGRACGPPVVNHYGENCVQDGECGLGLHCHWGMCLNVLVTAQYVPDGFACQTNEDCCSKRCQIHTINRFGTTGRVRVCGLKTDGSAALPGC